MDSPTRSYEGTLSAQQQAGNATEVVDRTRAALRDLGMFQISGTNPFWERHPNLAHHQRLVQLSVDTVRATLVLVLETTDESYRFSEPSISVADDGTVTITEGNETSIFSSEPSED